MTREILFDNWRIEKPIRTIARQYDNTNCIDIDIPSSLSGDGVWPEVPSEFSQMEERLNDLYAHPPRPGSNGTWMLWDVDAQKYEDSDIPLPESGGYGNIASAEINEIKVLDLDEYKSIEEKDSKTLYLIRG